MVSFRLVSEVHFFIHCTNFSNHYNFLNIQKKLGKQRLSGILEWEIFKKREELKLTKIKLKIFNFLSEIAIRLAKFYHKNFNPFWSWKCNFGGISFSKNWILKLYIHGLSNFWHINFREKKYWVYCGFFCKSIGE